jgi:hypothetical protein
MLLDLHPNYLEKDGKKEFVVLSIDEFAKIEDLLDDYEDLIDLRKAKEKEKNKSTKSLSDVKKELGL